MTLRATTTPTDATSDRGKCLGYRCDCPEYKGGFEKSGDWLLCARCHCVRETHRRKGSV